MAVSHGKRHVFLPDVPTFKEKGYNVISFIGRLFVAPKNMDPEKLNYLREKIKTIFDLPAYQESMKKANFSVDYMSGPDLQAFLKEYAETSKKLLDKYIKK